MDDIVECAPLPRGPKLKVKRYGRSDYEKFEEESALGSHLCVGSDRIDKKVEIDCKYHWKKAQWGVLGNADHPAGIVYMDITFKQPYGYLLKDATVFITLSEKNCSYALINPSKKHPSRGSGSDGVQMTQHFGPETLMGQKSVQSQTKSTNMTPTLGAMGFELGGLGYTSSLTKENTSRWVFQGTTARPKDGNEYRTLEWRLRVNELDRTQPPCQDFRTAFAFEHRYRPVYMRVEVQGSLNKKSLRAGKKFSSMFGTEDRSTLTHMDLRGLTRFKKNLDGIAQGLDASMQRENLEKRPMEVPDAMSASFTTEDAASSLPMPDRFTVKSNSWDYLSEPDAKAAIISDLKKHLENSPELAIKRRDSTLSTIEEVDSEPSNTLRGDISDADERSFGEDSMGDEMLLYLRQLLDNRAIYMLINLLLMFFKLFSSQPKEEMPPKRFISTHPLEQKAKVKRPAIMGPAKSRPIQCQKVKVLKEGLSIQD